MGKQIRVPIRVRERGDGSRVVVADERPAVVEPDPAVIDERPVAEEEAVSPGPGRASGDATSPPSGLDEDEIKDLQEELETWRDRALRAQAEMDNYRKRQQRLASEQIQASRARLLRNFLDVADDLERALRAEGDEEALREGLVITYRSLGQLLQQEGVEKIEARGETFDPAWHEAVATVPHRGANVSRDTVVEVTREGYRLNERLLRPARVVVAK